MRDLRQRAQCYAVRPPCRPGKTCLRPRPEIAREAFPGLFAITNDFGLSFTSHTRHLPIQSHRNLFQRRLSGARGTLELRGRAQESAPASSNLTAAAAIPRAPRRPGICFPGYLTPAIRGAVGLHDAMHPCRVSVTATHTTPSRQYRSRASTTAATVTAGPSATLESHSRRKKSAPSFEHAE